MRFRFRFDTLLKVRKIRLDLAEQEFARAQKHLADLETLRNQALSRRSDFSGKLVKKMGTGIRSYELDSYHAYFSRLDAEIVQVERLIVKAGRQLEAKRQELLTARRELKAIERLREIDGERFRTEQLKADARFMDELAIQRHGSRQ